jgi:hypothetical protein
MAAAWAGSGSANRGCEELSNMTESSFMQGWLSLIGSLAMIALILTAIGIMLGIRKPADAPRHIGAIVGIVIVLIFMRGVFVSAWSGLSLWQRIVLGRDRNWFLAMVETAQ